jgi:hypothetical protein
VGVPALRPGNYIAVWKLTDVNGDTRVVATRFIEARGKVGPAPKTKVTLHFTGASDVSITVIFPRNRRLGGSLRIRLARGGAVVALGHARVRRGRARLTMHVLRAVGSGSWHATLVLSRPHFEPVTIRVPVR